MRNHILFAVPLMILACSSQGLEGDPGVSHRAECQTRPEGSVAISRACVFDSRGETYGIDDTLDVVPITPPYGIQVHFKDGYAPLPADVSTQGPDASVRVYAAPYDVQNDTRCCSESSESNRIDVQMDLSASGVLTVTVPQAFPSGYQIAFMLRFGVLYRGRVSPVCDLPNEKFCGYLNVTGFGGRFYVGSLPGSSTPVPASQVPVSPPTAGACLLSYNTALVNESADPCCYRQGGSNRCDPQIQCNERSGVGCCLIYGTEATRGGQRCCRYEDGGAVDEPAECAELLASP